ncbi:DNA repair protein RecN-like [Palaemon carinicauda]|uniref:DNA repair protein RecN-like n=1 Tax=Palaemon carinicauda TaxID=392227 RepID=UPI0035B58BD2
MKECRIHPNVIDTLEEIYEGDKTKKNIGYELDKEFELTSGIKQGCTGSTTLFKLITYKIKPEEIEGIKVTDIIRYLGIEIEGKRNMFKKQKKKMMEKAEKLANLTYSIIAKSCYKILIGKTYWKNVALPGILYGTAVMNIKRLQQIENGENNEVKRRIKVQESLVDLYIQEEKEKEEGLRIIKQVEEIKTKGGMNSTAFWEFKKKVDRKNASKCTAIRGKGEEIIEDVEEIKKEYDKFYSDLFKLENPQNKEETLAEEINNMFDKWLLESDRMRSSKEEKITYQEVEAIVKSLKDKYTTDRQGLNNVVI